MPLCCAVPQKTAISGKLHTNFALQEGKYGPGCAGQAQDLPGIPVQAGKRPEK
jgi:hypothetical protein